MKVQSRMGRLSKMTVILLFSLVVFYLIVSFYFGKCFFPNTVINGFQYGNVTAVEARVAISTRVQGYSLEVYGKDLKSKEDTLLFTVTGMDIQLINNIKEEDVEGLLAAQDNFLWPARIFGSYEYQLDGAAQFDEEKLNAFLLQQAAFQDSETVLPQDAYIRGYSAETGLFDIVSEKEGTRLQKEMAISVIKNAISCGENRINLREAGCYFEPKVSKEEATEKGNVAQIEKMTSTEITYDWNGNEVVLNKDLINDWIVFQDGRFTIDREKVAAFVSENATLYDTYGKDRVFHTTLGYDLTLPSGSFGWLTDKEAEIKELTSLIEEGAVTSRIPVYSSKAPWKGKNDIGNSYVEADLTNQHLYLYKNGQLVLESEFVSGDMSRGYNTPQGVFGVTYKTTNAVLRGADYQEPVSYWMPYEGNYGMHDASWRDTFGGDIYLNNGSHGCLNLPLDKAQAIYNYVSAGFPVICYYYPDGMLPPKTPAPVYEDEDDD